MQGNRQLSTGQSVTGAQNFAIDGALRKLYTMLPVKVASVEQAAPTDQVGYVDVVPLIRQVDGEGNAVDTSPLYRLPFFRLQAGANAVIVNPQPGDKGAALFAMRDISVLKSTRDGPVQPGTRRFLAAGDGYYLGGWLNDAPERYVMIDDQGVTIEGVAKIEKTHEERYLKLLDNLKKGEVFKKGEKVMWFCRNCGHVHVGTKAPGVCPVCAHPQAYFEPKKENY